MGAREAAVAATELLIQEYVDPTAGLARAEARVAVKPMQRGRTGTNTAFDSKHPRGYHGKFAASGGGGQQPSAASIKAFQRNYGLTPTGQLDAATRATMKAPPPQTVSQQQSSEKAKAVKATVQKNKESREKAAEVAKAEGKPPPGTKAASSKTTSKTTKATTGSTRSEELKASNRASATKSANQAVATRRSKGELGTSRTSTAAKARAQVRAGLAGKQAIARIQEAGAWQGKLQVNETLGHGKGMAKGEQPSPAVGLVQAKLTALGYSVGSAGVDGKLGAATESAIRVLQREHGIQPTGRVEARTIQLLETLTERASQQERHGIIAADTTPLPGESIAGHVRRVLAVG